MEKNQQNQKDSIFKHKKTRTKSLHGFLFIKSKLA